MEKTLKNTPRPLLPSLNASTKNIRYKIKDNFERQNKKSITKNTKGIILSGKWMMENFRGTF